MADHEFIGREDIVAEAEGILGDGGSAVLTGPYGIGKSILLDTLAGDRLDGVVLRAAPAQAEADLPFATLTTLLEPLERAVLDTIAAPQRRALDAAMLRGAAPDVPPDSRVDPLAVRLAVLDALRTLVRCDGGVLLVIDDTHCVDPASAEVLAFAGRHLGGTVRVLGAERVDPGDRPPAYPRVAPGARPVPVTALSAQQTRRLLRSRLDAPFSAAVLARVHEASAGNPLFALEIGRALLRRNHPPAPGELLPVPVPIRELMSSRLAELSEATRAALLLVAIAARPTRQLLHAVLGECAGTALDEAAGADVVAVAPGGAVRFDHPLLAATLSAQAGPAQLRQAHGRLATALTDRVECARHLALATPGPAEDVAATLTAGAASAHGRGAPGMAAELARLAAEHTPADAPGRTAERLLAAAQYATDAGDDDHAAWLAECVLADAPERAHRVHARLLLVGASGRTLPEQAELVDDAFRDAAGDPHLQAPIHVWRSQYALLCGRLSEADQQAESAAALALRIGDRETRTRALCHQAVAQLSMADPRVRDTAAAAATAAPDGRAPGDRSPQYRSDEYWGPHLLRVRIAIVDDDLDWARDELHRLIRAADGSGAVGDLIGMLDLLVVVDTRSGHCAAACEHAARISELSEATGLSRAPSLASAALAEACGGDVTTARELARRSADLALDAGNLAYRVTGLLHLGQAALVGQDTDAALAALTEAREVAVRLGVVEPAVMRWHADLAEALVGAGRVAEADELVAEHLPIARRLGRASVLAGLERARALCLAETGQLDTAAEAAREAAEQADRFPLERGRSLLALGAVLWRLRRRAAAREATHEAGEVFSAAQALPWASRAVAAGARMEGGHEGTEHTAALTAGERRIADLAVSGATNREIASRLYLSVKTVEAHLSRVYAKLGVRSRAELARLAPHDGLVTGS